MSKEVKKYNWVYDDDKYTLLEYLTELNKLISSPVTQMQECEGDLFMSEYQKLVTGKYKLSSLIDQIKKEKEE